MFLLNVWNIRKEKKSGQSGKTGRNNFQKRSFAVKKTGICHLIATMALTKHEVYKHKDIRDQRPPLMRLDAASIYFG